MIITGFHAIEERILSLEKSKINPGDYKIYYSKPGPRVKKIIAEAQGIGVNVTQSDEKSLDLLVSCLDKSLRDHRGIVLEVAGKQQKSANLIDFDVWVKSAGAKSEDEKQTVVILDKITDPHNVGAILRSADQFGASLVIIPENNASNNLSNEVISRSSAGASAWVPVSIVKNLVRATDLLKNAGFWIYGADAGGENCVKMKFPNRTVFVMGSEGSGISRLLQEKCDTIVSIPTCGQIDSLNVSVAAGVLLYERYRATV